MELGCYLDEVGDLKFLLFYDKARGAAGCYNMSRNGKLGAKISGGSGFRETWDMIFDLN